MNNSSLMVDKKVVTELINVYMKDYFTQRWIDPYGEQRFKLERLKTFKQIWRDDNECSLGEEIKKITPNLLSEDEEQFLIEAVQKDPKTVYDDINKLFDLIDNEQTETSIKNLITKIIKEDFEIPMEKANRVDNGYKIISFFLWLKYPDKYYLYNPFSFNNLSHIISGPSESSEPFDKLKNAYDMYNSFAKILEKTLKEQQLSAMQAQNITLVTLANDIEYFWSQKKQENEAEEIINDLMENNNYIFYGIPGCGKSYKVKKMLENRGLTMDSKRVERVVFYPDYTYSDFVGCLLPYRDSNNSLDYKFKPGPFTRILERAIKSLNNPAELNCQHYLIIEELNRGNAAAIFGDLFQLLDRDESGESEYPVSNADVSSCVFGDKSESGEKKIYLPRNLAIYATMNTSDQNIFRMDTAFQRRWSMQLVTESGNNEDVKDTLNTTIPNTSIKWGTFLKIVNDKIAEQNRNSISTEDKRIGTFFIKKHELLDSDSSPFVYKVLKYLWDDVFRTVRGTELSVFNDKDGENSKIKTFDDIVRCSKEKNKDFLESVLDPSVYKAMKEDKANG